jgi:hypothetical protein
MWHFIFEVECPPLRLERQLPSKTKWKQTAFDIEKDCWLAQLGSGEAKRRKAAHLPSSSCLHAEFRIASLQPFPNPVQLTVHFCDYFKY